MGLWTICNMTAFQDRLKKAKQEYIEGALFKNICKKYDISYTSLVRELKASNIYNGKNHSTRALLFSDTPDKLSNLDIIQDLTNIFNIRLLGDILLIDKWGAQNKHIVSNKILYICVDFDTNKILKVGQTCSWRNRLVYYKYKEPILGLIRVVLFEVDSWELQDKLEIEIRKYLISLGHTLPWDNTNGRLNK